MMSHDKLNIFIAGARGFIGKNLIEYLNNLSDSKYKLFYPYHSDLELLNGKEVEEFITENDIDVIVDCANVGGSRKTAYDSGRKVDVISRNQQMFFNLARSLSSARRMIFFGSGAEYDMRHYKPHMSEDYFGKHVPLDSYGYSKYLCSRYVMDVNNVINLRLFGVFGKYEDYEFKFISNAIVKNLFGLPISINQNVYFDFLYINDLVKIIEYFIRSGSKYKIYNAVTSKTIDLVTIANRINQIADKPSDIVVKNKGLGTEYSGDNSRLLEELKGFNFTPFDIALKELYLWYKGRISQIDKEEIIKDEYIKYCRTKDENE